MEGQIELFDYLSTIDITKYIPIGNKNAIRRRYLCTITGLSDRKMRRAIHDARHKTVILNLSNGDGYFLPDMDDPLDRKLLVRFVQQEQSRIKSINGALEAAKKMLSERGGADGRAPDVRACDNTE